MTPRTLTIPEQKNCPECHEPVIWETLGDIRYWHCPTCADPLTNLSRDELQARLQCATAVLCYVRKQAPHLVTEGCVAVRNQYLVETIESVMETVR